METLRIGDSGADVQLLQLALGRAGYSVGSIDGIFGQNTQNAVIKFQNDYRLIADGVVGPRTWQSLEPFLLGYIEHRVQWGDSYWSLANRYKTTISAIAAANPEVNPQRLQIGQILIIPLSFNVVPTNIVYTSHLVDFIVRGLKARYPFVKTGSIGKSVMGKEIPYLIIGAGSTQVSYNASHHANEWITTPVLLKFLEQYAAAYSHGGRINNVPASSLYNKASLYLVPMVNPDGVDLVNGVINSGNYYTRARTYANNYPSIPFPRGWKANIEGIDLNLQYPASWEEARRIKYAQGFVSPAPRDFVGMAPLTAPESRAMHDFTEQNKFSLILAYHTQGEVIFWKYLDYLPVNSREIAGKMGRASGYAVIETPRESAFAGYKDWFIQEYNRPGYTIEAGLGENPLPISQFDNIYRKNIGILTLGITEI